MNEKEYTHTHLQLTWFALRSHLDNFQMSHFFIIKKYEIAALYCPLKRLCIIQEAWESLYDIFIV